LIPERDPRPAGPARTGTEIQTERLSHDRFGIALLIIAALLPKLAILWGIGVIVLVVGVILAVLGTMGRAVGGRRHYY
jgi:hypothetical protein